MKCSWVGAFAIILVSGAQAAEPEFTSFVDAKAVLNAFADSLPPALRKPDAGKWSKWSRENDRNIRARLEDGDLDSMVNLLLFGTSFTQQPRIGMEHIVEMSRSGVLNARVADLVSGMASLGSNERLKILRALILKKGIDPGTPEGAAKAGVFVLDNLKRVLQERVAFTQRAGKQAQSGPAETAASLLDQRAELFSGRGVSLDTAILPNFAIDSALRELKQHNVLREGQVARMAVIGPGLAFIDKDEQIAYDYFPQQTIQPFALIDSLLRLGLSSRANLKLTAFDISPRVIAHFGLARKQAAANIPYAIQLPQDWARPWSAALEGYWRILGDQVGVNAPPLQPPAVFSGLKTRSISVRPEVVLQCQAVDLDFVTQRLTLPRQDQFDLIVATNVFLYYDRFQQALALQNTAAMLKPGGLLLANDGLPLTPGIGMRLLGASTVYDQQPGGLMRDADAVSWYVKE